MTFPLDTAKAHHQAPRILLTQEMEVPHNVCCQRSKHIRPLAERVYISEHSVQVHPDFMMLLSLGLLLLGRGKNPQEKQGMFLNRTIDILMALVGL